MATNVKISELPVKTEVNDTDLVIVQDGNTTDVITAANLMKGKANTSSLSAVARSGSYNDLIDTPKVVTKDVTELTNFYNKTVMDALLSAKTNTSDFSILESTVSQKADQATTLAGYSITDAYTKTECDNTFAEKATTLAGYGITDAYTKDEANAAISTAKSATITYVAENYVKKEYVDNTFATKTTVSALDTALASTQGSVNTLLTLVGDLQTNKFNTPLVKTIAGFGITDAYTKDELYTKTEIDSKLASTFHYKGTVNNYSDLPTIGQEVGDVWNIVNADTTHGIKKGDNVAWTGSAWDVLAGVTDLSNYYNITESDSRFAAITHEHSIGEVVGLQASLDDLSNNKANSDDVYTKTEVDDLLADKVSQTQLETELNNYLSLNVGTAYAGKTVTFTVNSAGKLTLNFA